jgi:dTDP-4-amino-4,6-dideoxy-D-galactose acyltransferase
MGADSICEYLEWDSEFFGRRIARAGVSSLTKESVAEIDAWCSLHRIDCLYFLASSADQRTAELAQAKMFRLVDIRVTFELPAEKFSYRDSSSFGVRSAVEKDIPALRAIARGGHRDSRFYYDGNFSQHLCDELYETWIEKSCRGWAKRVLVAEGSGLIEGYLTCHLPSSEHGQIGLVGVADKAQGRGVGTDLLSCGVAWFARQRVRSISVVTQGRNIGAQRLYQKCGFATRSVELWFHRWFSGEGGHE